MSIRCTFFLLLYLLNACNHFQKKEVNLEDKEWASLAEEKVKKMLGSKINLPKNLPIYSGDSVFSTYDSVLIAPARILVYLDGGCGTCLLNLRRWLKIESDIAKSGSNCDFLFFVQTDNKEAFKQEVVAKLEGSVRWVADPKNEFINSNDITDQRFQTVMVDKDNRILMVGSIMLRPELEKLYKEMILEYGK